MHRVSVRNSDGVERGRCIGGISDENDWMFEFAKGLYRSERIVGVGVHEVEIKQYLELKVKDGDMVAGMLLKSINQAERDYLAL